MFLHYQTKELDVTVYFFIIIIIIRAEVKGLPEDGRKRERFYTYYNRTRIEIFTVTIHYLKHHRLQQAIHMAASHYQKWTEVCHPVLAMKCHSAEYFQLVPLASCCEWLRTLSARDKKICVTIVRCRYQTLSSVCIRKDAETSKQWNWPVQGTYIHVLVFL